MIVMTIIVIVNLKKGVVEVLHFGHLIILMKIIHILIKNFKVNIPVFLIFHLIFIVIVKLLIGMILFNYVMVI